MSFRAPTVLGISAPAAARRARARGLRKARKPGSPSSGRGAVAARQQVLQRLPQLLRPRGRARLREDQAGELRPARRDAREGGPQAARPPDAAAEGAAARRASGSCPFVSWLENSLDAAAANQHGYPAIAPQRLNRKEYANAVRDLLALDVDAAEFLPQDEEVERFDNIASGAAGVAVVHRAVRDRGARGRGARGRPARTPGPAARPTRRAPATSSRTWKACRSARAAASPSTHLFPSDGEYAINIADMVHGDLGQRLGVREPRSS